MPRKRAISRTFHVVDVCCLVVDKKNQVLFDKYYTLLRKCKNDDLYLKACRKLEDNPDYDVIKVKGTKEKTVLAKKDERAFYDSAEIIYLN